MISLTRAELASSSHVKFICGRIYATVPPFLLNTRTACLLSPRYFTSVLTVGGAAISIAYPKQDTVV